MLGRKSVTVTSTATTKVDASALAGLLGASFPGGELLGGFSGTFRKPGAFQVGFSGAYGSLGDDAGRVGTNTALFPNAGPVIASAPSPFSIDGAAVAYSGGRALRDASLPYWTSVVSGIQTITIPVDSARPALVSVWNRVKSATASGPRARARSRPSRWSMPSGPSWRRARRRRPRCATARGRRSGWSSRTHRRHRQPTGRR